MVRAAWNEEAQIQNLIILVVALDQEQQKTLKRYVGFDNDEKCFILAYENEARYPGEVIKLKSFEVQGVARHVIKAL